ncbi:MAG TPA: Ig-like domain-containing protein, partial [Phycisphaerae bacterium]|nr:Ig-like domain-containing protein [Phycisphaerae bacterium]
NETGGCGPLPPVASSGSVTVTVNTSKNITLVASDANHDPLTYIVTSLPTHGSLTDPTGNVPISSVPYTIAGGLNVVSYTTQGYIGADSFQFKANDGGTPPTGGDSNIATESLTIAAPTANNGSATTNINTAKNVTLVGSDANNSTLAYIITALPAHGSLRDLGNNGTIASVPYTLAGGGNAVRYYPAPSYLGADTFQFKVNVGGAGGDSNVATVTITIISPPPISFPLDTNPGWTTMGQWAFGQPTGTCGDPSSGYTGTNVYGYNLAGCYPNSLSPTQYLTTTAINCSGLTGVTLQFRRWLGVEQNAYDHATVDVSKNGTTWTNIYANGNTSLIETAWSLQTYDISAIADNQPTVYIRWGMGTTDTSVTYCGWNIDDIQLLANNYIPPCGAIVHGDMNFDGAIDGKDIQRFIQVLLGSRGLTQAEICAADAYTDGVVDLLDLNEMVTLLLNVSVP